MWLYSIPYLFFLLFLVCVVFWEISLKRQNQYGINRIRLILWCGFILFLGFRGFVNTDCLSYYPFFEKLKTLWDTDATYSQVIFGYDWEPGFIASAYLFKSILPNYQLWILLWTIIFLWSLDFIFTRYVKYYSLAFLLSFIFGGYALVTNLMRASIAMCFFLWSIPALLEGKWKKYILLNIVGCLFHVSSLMYILTGFVLKKRFPVFVLYIIFIILFSLNVLGVDLSIMLTKVINVVSESRIALLIERYQDASANSFFSIGNIERMFTYLLVCFSYKRMIVDDNRSVVFLNAYILYFFFFYAFFRLGDVAQRLADLFVFSYWIFYAKYYQYMSIVGNKVIFLFFLVLYSCLKLISGMSAPYHQYKNVLWNQERFEEAEKRIYYTE